MCCKRSLMLTGYLFHLTQEIVDSLNMEELKTQKRDLLKQLTKPLTSRIVQVSLYPTVQYILYKNLITPGNISAFDVILVSFKLLKIKFSE